MNMKIKIVHFTTVLLVMYACIFPQFNIKSTLKSKRNLFILARVIGMYAMWSKRGIYHLERNK